MCHDMTWYDIICMYLHRWERERDWWSRLALKEKTAEDKEAKRAEIAARVAAAKAEREKDGFSAEERVQDTICPILYVLMYWYWQYLTVLIVFPEVEIVKVFEEAKKKEIEEKGATSHYGEHQGITCVLSSVLKWSEVLRHNVAVRLSLFDYVCMETAESWYYHLRQGLVTSADNANIYLRWCMCCCSNIWLPLCLQILCVARCVRVLLWCLGRWHRQAQLQSTPSVNMLELPTLFSSNQR